jgi:hypothetical protein
MVRAMRVLFVGTLHLKDHLWTVPAAKSGAMSRMTTSSSTIAPGASAGSGHRTCVRRCTYPAHLRKPIRHSEFLSPANVSRLRR